MEEEGPALVLHRNAITKLPRDTSMPQKEEPGGEEGEQECLLMLTLGWPAAWQTDMMDGWLAGWPAVLPQDEQQVVQGERGDSCKCFASMTRKLQSSSSTDGSRFQPPLACALCHAAVPHCNFSKLIDSLLEIFFTFPSSTTYLFSI